MWLASCFPDCLPPFSFFLCLLFFYCVVVFLYPFLCRLSFCLSLALHVSVLFPSCVISPVSLYLVSDTRVSCIPRPGCHAIPFRISVFSFSLPLFLSARMRIYYNVSLLPDFPSSLKKHVLQHICQSAFYKNVQEKLEKIPLYIWRVYYKVLLLHPLSRTGAAMF